jgi:hypothetical protein
MVRLCDPACDRGVRPFRDLGQRPADQARRASDVVPALIEASGGVSKDEHLSGVWQSRIVDENRQSGARSPGCTKSLAVRS